MEPLAREFYDRDTTVVARDLLGRWLVHRGSGGERIGRIVETEAYDGPGDLACHASRGMTPRTEVMFGLPGFIYVYLVYGMHHCLNFVTGAAGYPAAVLIRALEPIKGLELSTQGPGRLCRAMEIDIQHNKQDATCGQLFVAPGELVSPSEIVASARIGVDYAGDWASVPYRFSIEGNPWVSRRPSVRQKQATRRGRR